MAIKPNCVYCKEELTEYGALLLSPPDNKNNIRKLHLCKKCYNEIIDLLNSKNTCGATKCSYQDKNKCTFEIIDGYGCKLYYDNSQCVDKKGY
jgi:hypothetical protein